MYYTQDESYYLLDAKEGATVYLGLKTGIDKNEMIEDLRKAQKGEIVFNTEKYVNKLPAKKHDHYLIPGGTVHCSGSEALVHSFPTRRSSDLLKSVLLLTCLLSSYGTGSV